MVSNPMTAVDAEAQGPSRSRHFVLFDAMRAVAVLGVLVVHVGAASHANMNAWYGVATSQGRLGVRIFFVISAFLLYRPFVMAHLQGTPGPALSTFAKRRALRILPAYWVALVALSIWPGLPGVWSPRWWIYFGMLQGYYPKTLFKGLPVAWSLSVEVAFYATLPFLAMFLGALGRRVSARARMRRQVWALVALAFAGETFRLSNVAIGRLEFHWTLPSMFLPFALGMLLAVSSAWLGTDERRWRWTRFVIDRPGACWLAAAAIFVTLCFTPVFIRTSVGKHTVVTQGIEQFAYAVISALLLLPAIFGENAGGWPRRILATRVMAFTGAISYGIFLWHQPMLRAMNQAGWAKMIPGFPFLSLFTLCLGVAVVLGWGSYRLIEAPAMRLRGEAPKRAV